MSSVAVQHIVVGARDFDRSLHLYRDLLGLEVRRGPEPVTEAELALWGLPAHTEATAATLSRPKQWYGLIRLVSFGAANGDPVRLGARPYDYSPKNLDIQVRDMAEGYAKLRAAGYDFRSEPVAYEHDGHTIHEVQMKGPDEVNVVLLQTDSGADLPFSEQGFAGVTQWVLTVGDLEGMGRFFEEGLGIPIVLRNKLAGPDIERMVGLPPGAALHIFICAGDSSFGRIELVHYSGVDSKDLTSLARPPRSGMLQVGFAVDDLDATLAKIGRLGFETVCAPRDAVDPVGKHSRAASVAAPDGLMIELWQR